MTFSVVINDSEHSEDYLTLLQHEYMKPEDIKLMLHRQIIEEYEDGDKEYREEMHAIVVNYRELLRAIDAVVVDTYAKEIQ
jgi:hypothetical protein